MLQGSSWLQGRAVTLMPCTSVMTSENKHSQQLYNSIVFWLCLNILCHPNSSKWHSIHRVSESDHRYVWKQSGRSHISYRLKLELYWPDPVYKIPLAIWGGCWDPRFCRGPQRQVPCGHSTKSISALQGRDLPSTKSRTFHGPHIWQKKHVFYKIKDLTCEGIKTNKKISLVELKPQMVIL